MTTNIKMGDRAAARPFELPKVNYKRASEYGTLMDYINALSLKYGFIDVSSLGVSIMGREIPVIRLGRNRDSAGVLYVGGLVGCDIMTPAVLLRFAYDYAQFLESGRRMYSVSMPYLFESRTVHIVPMLNPDGYVIRRDGAEGMPNYAELCKMKDGVDFANWRYNARGADLTEAFVTGFGAEEPEASALCRYVKTASGGALGEIKLAVTLNVDSCGIKYKSGKTTAPRAKTIGRLMERMSGAAIDERSMQIGAFSSWFVRELMRPAFDFGCLAFEGERITDGEEYVKIYASLREVLFSSPLLI